jgi:hypothetical protein
MNKGIHYLLVDIDELRKSIIDTSVHGVLGIEALGEKFRHLVTVVQQAYYEILLLHDGLTFAHNMLLQFLLQHV